MIAVGTRIRQWVSDAWHDYAKRLPTDCSLELKEIKPEPRTSGKSPAQLMQAEASRITTALPTNALYIALDKQGATSPPQGLLLNSRNGAVAAVMLFSLSVGLTAWTPA